MVSFPHTRCWALTAFVHHGPQWGVSGWLFYRSLAVVPGKVPSHLLDSWVKGVNIPGANLGDSRGRGQRRGEGEGGELTCPG